MDLIGFRNRIKVLVDWGWSTSPPGERERSWFACPENPGCW